MEARPHSRALLAMVGRLAEQDPADVQAILAEFSAADCAELTRLIEVYQQGNQPFPPVLNGHPEPLAAPPNFSAWLTEALTMTEPSPLKHRTQATTSALQRIARDHGWQLQVTRPNTSQIDRLVSKLRFRP